MKIYTFVLLSKNPVEQRSPLDLLISYLEHPSVENLYVHFGDYPKLGINPRSEFDTPNGIYCYSLHTYAERLRAEHSNLALKQEQEPNDKTPKAEASLIGMTKVFPFASDKDFLILFEDNKPAHNLYIQRESRYPYTKAQFQKDFYTLAKFLVEKVNDEDLDLETSINVLHGISLHSTVQNVITAASNRLEAGWSVSSYAVMLWYITKTIANVLTSGILNQKLEEQRRNRKRIPYKDKTDTELLVEKIKSLPDQSKTPQISETATTHWVKNLVNHVMPTVVLKDTTVWPLSSRLWANIFRYLGYTGAVDHGSGVIHRNEPKQAVFFSNKTLTLLQITRQLRHKQRDEYQKELLQIKETRRIVNHLLSNPERMLDPKAAAYIRKDKKLLAAIAQHVKNSRRPHLINGIFSLLKVNPMDAIEAVSSPHEAIAYFLAYPEAFDDAEFVEYLKQDAENLTDILYPLSTFHIYLQNASTAIPTKITNLEGLEKLADILMNHEYKNNKNTNAAADDIMYHLAFTRTLPDEFFDESLKVIYMAYVNEHLVRQPDKLNARSFYVNNSPLYRMNQLLYNRSAFQDMIKADPKWGGQLLVALINGYVKHTGQLMGLDRLDLIDSLLLPEVMASLDDTESEFVKTAYIGV